MLYCGCQICTDDDNKNHCAALVSSDNPNSRTDQQIWNLKIETNMLKKTTSLFITTKRTRRGPRCVQTCEHREQLSFLPLSLFFHKLLPNGDSTTDTCSGFQNQRQANVLLHVFPASQESVCLNVCVGHPFIVSALTGGKSLILLFHLSTNRSANKQTWQILQTHWKQTEPKQLQSSDFMSLTKDENFPHSFVFSSTVKIKLRLHEPHHGATLNNKERENFTPVL